MTEAAEQEGGAEDASVLPFLYLGVFRLYTRERHALLCGYHSSKLNNRKPEVKKILFGHLALVPFEVRFCVSILQDGRKTETWSPIDNAANYDGTFRKQEHGAGGTFQK